MRWVIQDQQAQVVESRLTAKKDECKLPILSMTQRHSSLRTTWKREALSGSSCVLGYAFVSIQTLANPEKDT